MAVIHTYHINLAERGEFYADVRDSSENTVYELRTDADTGEIPEIDCGFMRHTTDLCGLLEHLQSIGILGQYDRLIMA